MSDKQKRVFLYTDETGIDTETVAMLLANGFLPVKVADISQTRIIEPSIAVDLDGATIDMLANAALETIEKMNSGTAHGHFATIVLHRMKSLRR